MELVEGHRVTNIRTWFIRIITTDLGGGEREFPGEAFKTNPILFSLWNSVVIIPVPN